MKHPIQAIYMQVINFMTLYGTSRERLDLQPTKQQASDIYESKTGKWGVEGEGGGKTSRKAG